MLGYERTKEGDAIPWRPVLLVCVFMLVRVGVGCLRYNNRIGKCQSLKTVFAPPSHLAEA